MSEAAPHAVVIGSGFGGLAAALRIAAKGWAVTVVEKLDAPGGRAYVYQQDGFTFDAGPTIITAPYLLEELWALAGAKLSDDVDLRPMDPFYLIRFDDGDVIRCSATLEGMRAEVERIAPDDLPHFERFLKDSAKIYKVAFEDLADKPFHTLGSLISAAPDLIKLGGFRSVYSKICDYFTNEKLRIAFSFHPLMIGGNPFTTTAYYCLISHLERLHGVHFAMGGTGTLVKGLARLIEKLGGTFCMNAQVDEILIKDGSACGVRLSTGEVIEADLVVSNADPAWTYSKLMKHQPRKRWTDRKLARQSYSMSLFVWYFGTNRRYDDVYHHLMVLGPRYKELLGDIFDRKKLADDFSLYLHRPTMTDPSLAPEGCDAFYALSPVPHLESGVDWASFAQTYQTKIMQRLEETVMPGLSQSIVTSRVLTPQDFQDRLSSVKGAAFSFEPKLFQSAWFRPHNKSEECRRLYLVGAGTHPGAGLPGVISSARVVADLVPEAKDFQKEARAGAF
jgi:phytoene desaturase